ncbi:hypothetical protein Xedl_02551 [Xenorhabdus eapokensis]|uniref:Uncharacterized protein n=1 Tax=Xenorhabdus eapokensis TaxID=1873482 RepID=A0A1Q5TPC4_9GAMM|nr:hypothetical protein Xedl_02551 [Xenorhabdus eapokensis]
MKWRYKLAPRLKTSGYTPPDNCRGSYAGRYRGPWARRGVYCTAAMIKLSIHKYIENTKTYQNKIMMIDRVFLTKTLYLLKYTFEKVRFIE